MKKKDGLTLQKHYVSGLLGLLRTVPPWVFVFDMLKNLYYFSLTERNNWVK